MSTGCGRSATSWRSPSPAGWKPNATPAPWKSSSPSATARSPELAGDKSRLRAAWDADCAAMHAEHDRLTREIGEITRQLDQARQREAAATLRCRHLEDLLDRLDNLPAPDDETASTRPAANALDAAAGQRADPLEVLNPREREVLALMAEGQSRRGIAAHLCYSPRTIDHHVSAIFTKLGIRSINGVARPAENLWVLAVLEFLGAGRGPRSGGTSSSPVSMRPPRAAGELAPPGGVEGPP